MRKRVFVRLPPIHFGKSAGDIRMPGIKHLPDTPPTVAPVKSTIRPKKISPIMPQAHGGWGRIPK